MLSRSSTRAWSKSFHVENDVNRHRHHDRKTDGGQPLGGSAAHRAVTGQQRADQSQPEQQDENNGRWMRFG